MYLSCVCVCVYLPSFHCCYLIVSSFICLPFIIMKKIFVSNGRSLYVMRHVYTKIKIKWNDNEIYKLFFCVVFCLESIACFFLAYLSSVSGCTLFFDVFEVKRKFYSFYKSCNKKVIRKGIKGEMLFNAFIWKLSFKF